jgi:hypothetical protein
MSQFHLSHMNSLLHGDLWVITAKKVVITHKLITRKKVMREGLDGRPGERSDGLPNST